MLKIHKKKITKAGKADVQYLKQKLKLSCTFENQNGTLSECQRYNNNTRQGKKEFDMQIHATLLNLHVLLTHTHTHMEIYLP